MLLFPPSKLAIENRIRARVRSIGARTFFAIVAMIFFCTGSIFLGIAAHAQLVRALGSDAANLTMGTILIIAAGITLFWSMRGSKKQKPAAILAAPAKTSNEVLLSLAFTVAFAAARHFSKR